jgi:ribulose-phosphate 3-epimerase
MIQIIPAILVPSEKQYQENLDKLSSCEALKDGWVHIDFADNIFVPNETIKPEIVGKYPSGFKKEAHLMVSHPLEWIEKCIEAGFERVIFHIESEDNIDECIEKIKSRGLEVGLAISKDTAVEKVVPFKDKIDIILIMTIVAGFQGQAFIPAALEKVRLLKTENSSIKIGVDGAVKDENAKEIVESGVDFMISGSYLLMGNTDENLERLWEAING